MFLHEGGQDFFIREDVKSVLTRKDIVLTRKDERRGVFL